MDASLVQRATYSACSLSVLKCSAVIYFQISSFYFYIKEFSRLIIFIHEKLVFPVFLELIMNEIIFRLRNLARIQRIIVFENLVNGLKMVLNYAVVWLINQMQWSKLGKVPLFIQNTLMSKFFGRFEALENNFF